jgi:hypothetical protein
MYFRSPGGASGAARTRQNGPLSAFFTMKLGFLHIKWVFWGDFTSKMGVLGVILLVE